MAIIVSGSTVKNVRCETCGHTYSYVMQRTARAAVQGFTLNRQKAKECALAEANHKLQADLVSGFDVVPCPKCGAFTKQMKAKPWQNLILSLLFFILAVVLLGFAYLRAEIASRINIQAILMGLACLVIAIGALVVGLKRLLVHRMSLTRTNRAKQKE